MSIMRSILTIICMRKIIVDREFINNLILHINPIFLAVMVLLVYGEVSYIYWIFLAFLIVNLCLMIYIHYKKQK